MNTDTLPQIFSWVDLLQILALIYAGIEFMNANKSLKFVFRNSRQPLRTLFVIFSVVVLNLFSDLLPVIREMNSVNLSFTLPQIFLASEIYKVAAIALLTALILDYFLITIFPQILIKEIKYDKNNPKKFFEVIVNLLKYNVPVTSANYNLVCTILFENGNLRRIIRTLKDLTPEEMKDVKHKEVYEFINFTLTDRGFINYLASEDKGALLYILGIIKQEEAKDCYHFIKVLSSTILSKKSFLDLELGYVGDGFYQEIINNLYKERFFYQNYSIFDIEDESNIPRLELLKKLTFVMNASIEEYFSDQRNQSPNRIGYNPYHFGIKFLTGNFSSIVHTISNPESRSYEVRQSEEFQIINFFNHIPYVLLSNGQIDSLSEYEKNLQDGSLINDVVDSIFEILSDMAWLDNEHGQFIARNTALDLHWSWDNIHRLNDDIFDNIKNKIINLLEERVKENLNGHYPPIVRILLSIHGLGSDALSTMLKKYKTSLESLIEDKSTQKRYKPIDWVKDKTGNWVNEHGIIRFRVSRK